LARPAIFRVGPVSTARVEAFSDGVMAVALTLLVLNVRLPDHLASDAAIWSALWRQAPTLAAWVVSFAFVLVFWVNHHYFFASLRSADRGLMWLNGLFLLAITLVPFPTGLVGQYPGFAAPLAILSLVMMLAALSFAAMRLYASFHSRLLLEHIDARQARFAMAQSAIAPALYGSAAVLAFVWPPAAIAIQVLVPAIFFLRSPIRRVTRDEVAAG
jgi:uncharacterized membrane protein